jgi:lipopolysaccharide biosynthesis glycosyltransferase
MTLKQTYPPEIVVLVTPNVPPKVYEQLSPLCTRILPIDEWQPPLKTIDSKLGKGDKAWQRTLDNHCPGWTKLRIFGLQQYDTILYIDSDCLVLQDVSSLLGLNKIYTESESLIAAAPDILPPHHFNSGVMVIRPSTEVMETMKSHAKLLTTYDGSDTGFLNAYFNTWYTDFPPMARLASGYNAQQAMFEMTMDDNGNSSFWDVQIGSDLHIVHYSNAEKPWAVETATTTATGTKDNSLHTLWKTWYNKSKNFLVRYRKEEERRIRLEEEEEDQRRQAMKKQKAAVAAAVARRPAAAGTSGSNNNPRELHKLIGKRFKELRAQGKSGKEAMQQAREEYQQGDDAEIDPGSQVAAMFGMR